MVLNQIKLYGIKNCDQVKKAQKWFLEHNVSFDFIDYTTTAFENEWYMNLMNAVGIDRLVNRKSTTYRALNQEQKDLLNKEEGVIELLKQFPKLMKRPIVCQYSKDSLMSIVVGFSDDEYQQFNK